MKTVAVKIDDNLHKRLKIYAATQDKTVTEIVARLIQKDLETKKE